MNSTQYLVILITAVVCFCIYVVADIVRMNRRQRQIKSGNVGVNAGRLHSSLAIPAESPSSVPDYRIFSMTEAGWKNGTFYWTDEGEGRVRFEPTRLQEEIRTRLEGGDQSESEDWVAVDPSGCAPPIYIRRGA